LKPGREKLSGLHHGDFPAGRNLSLGPPVQGIAASKGTDFETDYLVEQSHSQHPEPLSVAVFMFLLC